MNELTDGQIDEIPFSKIDYCDGHVIRTHRRKFARAVIAADRELQDAKLTNAPTDNQINDALKVFACTVIGADRAIQDARWLEELRAYELTVSNLRAELMGCSVPDSALSKVLESAQNIRDLGRAIIGDGYKATGANLVSEALSIERAMLTAAQRPGLSGGGGGGGGGAQLLTPEMADELNARLSDHWFGCAQAVWDAVIAAAPQPPAQPERKPMNSDCTPNHLCCGRMVHLPNGEQCDKCGKDAP